MSGGKGKGGKGKDSTATRAMSHSARAGLQVSYLKIYVLFLLLSI